MRLVSLSGIVSLTIAWSAPIAAEAIDGPSGPTPRAVAVANANTSAKEPPVDISNRVIRKAIADSKDPMDDVPSVDRGSFGTAGTTAQQRIDRRFKDADIPTCLTPEAFKFDPPHIGPIGLGNYLALPFWLHAIATGRCRH